MLCTCCCEQDEDKIKNLANTLEQSVESHDRMLGDELKKAELLDRRRVCFFIKQWSKVLAEESEGMEAGLVLTPITLKHAQRCSGTGC